MIAGFDFASRALGSIGSLPNVMGVATGDDLEAVTRITAVLHAELDRRRRLLGAAMAEDLTAYNERHSPLPRILLLIDSYGSLVSTFTAGGGGSMSLTVPMEAWLERINQLIIDGRQVGIHSVLTADRRAALPARLQSAIAHRLVLRHADESGYGDHGIPAARAKSIDLAPGGALWQADLRTQVAVVSDDPSSPGQAAALSTLGGRVQGTLPAELRSQPLPEQVAFADLDEPGGPCDIALGRSDLTGATAVASIDRLPLLVMGPPGSGRSNALATVIASLSGRHDLWVVGPSSSPLADLAQASISVACGSAARIGEVLDHLVATMALGESRRPATLIVDDLDALDDAALNPKWEALLRAESVHLVAAIESGSFSGYTQNPMLNEVRRTRRLLFLQPADANDVMQTFGLKAPMRPGVTMTVGRGVLILGRDLSVVQVAVS